MSRIKIEQRQNTKSRHSALTKDLLRSGSLLISLPSPMLALSNRCSLKSTVLSKPPTPTTYQITGNSRQSTWINPSSSLTRLSSPRVVRHSTSALSTITLAMLTRSKSLQTRSSGAIASTPPTYLSPAQLPYAQARDELNSSPTGCAITFS